MPEIDPSSTGGTPELPPDQAAELVAAHERIAALERVNLSYAEQLKAKNVGRLRRTWNTKDQVVESRRPHDGVRTKATTDQNGHTTTEHADGRQDVTINLR